MHGCLYSRELLFVVAHLDFGPLRLAHQLMRDELGTNIRPQSDNHTHLSFGTRIWSVNHNYDQ